LRARKKKRTLVARLFKLRISHTGQKIRLVRPDANHYLPAVIDPSVYTRCQEDHHNWMGLPVGSVTAPDGIGVRYYFCQTVDRVSVGASKKTNDAGIAAHAFDFVGIFRRKELNETVPYGQPNVNSREIA